MAPICKLQPLVASVCRPVSYLRSSATLGYPSVDPELLKEIHKIPFAPRSPPSEQPSTSTSTTSSHTLSFELSALLARVFRKGVSVTTILSDTMPLASRIALQKWRRNQIALVFGGDEAAFSAEMQRVKRTGIHLHACIVRHLCGEPIAGEQLAPTSERHSIEGFWNSLYPVFEDIAAARLHEVHLAHPLLYYTGVFDSLIEYKGDLCLVDWKTKRNRRVYSMGDTYEDPLQLAAYAGAWNALPAFASARRAPPALPLTELEHLLERLRSKLNDSILQEAAKCKPLRGLLVYAYEDGACATAMQMPVADLYLRWNEWLERYDQFVRQRLQLESGKESSRERRVLQQRSH